MSEFLVIVNPAAGRGRARNVRLVPRFLTGFGAYLGALVLTLVRYPLLRVQLQLDDAPPFEFTTAMTAIMNGTSFGGSFRVCPDAQPDDGLLDLLLVEADGEIAFSRARRLEIEVLRRALTVLA